MTTTVIHIDLDALDKRLANGDLWSTDWGDWEIEGQPTCLHGAIHYCQPIPGDAYLIEQVGHQFGFGTIDNDNQASWPDVRALVQPDITDDMLAATFGPQWESIAALVRRAATLTVDEASKVAAAQAAAQTAADWDAAAQAAAQTAADWDAAQAAAQTAADWDAAQAAAQTAAWRAAARDPDLDPDRNAADWDATRNAAQALVVRDLIGQHGFTQTHYDTLTRPWRTVIGPVHPDDPELVCMDVDR